jgi:hypothetical protein
MEISLNFNVILTITNPVAIAKLIQNERDAKYYFGSSKLSLKLLRFSRSGNFSYLRSDSESFYYEPTNLYQQELLVTGVEVIQMQRVKYLKPQFRIINQ